MDFYFNADYRKCVRWGLERLRSRGEPVTLTGLAAAARVQAPYLSKALKGQAELNEDQLYLICRRLLFSSEESHFARLLLQYARAHVRERKDELHEEVEKIRQKKTSPTEQRNADKVRSNDDAHSRYYLNPDMQIAHMYLTIPKWRRDPLRLAESMKVSKSRLTEILKTLEELKILEHKAGSYHLLKEQLHLPVTSPLCGPQQALMKLAGLAHSRQLDSTEVYSFTATFSANKKAESEIREAFAEFLKKTEKIVADAPSEKVYQVQFDLFPWV